MVLRDSDAVQTELDKLVLIEPDEDVIAYIKMLVERGDPQVHVELHLSAVEDEYKALDTKAVRTAIRG